ncbi:hypothetical protein HYH07_02200, partial [Bradyrhizobium sp. BR 10261]|nr:hypothetical protein [Bradyrhizobium sp. BR 10261]
YAVWNTDANGNYLNNALGGVSGSSAGLESFETSFQQDLNGDSYIGIPPAHSSAISILDSNNFSFSHETNGSNAASHSPVVSSNESGLLTSTSEQSLSALSATVAGNATATPDDHLVLTVHLEHSFLL